MKDIFVEKHYLTRRNVRKRHIMGFIVLSVVMVGCIIAELSMYNWLRYCWWDFGLLHAESFTTFSNFHNEQDITDVHSDACKSLKHLVERNCPNFCSNIPKLEIGGSSMLICSVLAIVFYIICIVFHFWSFFKVQFKFRRIWIFFILPCFFYNLGVILYFFNINIQDLDSPNTSRFNTQAPTLKEGIYLAISIIPLSLILVAYGLLKTREEFLDKETDESK